MRRGSARCRTLVDNVESDGADVLLDLFQQLTDEDTIRVA